jgi:hypothetical protein
MHALAGGGTAGRQMSQMRLIRHFAAARRLLVVSVMVFAPAIALAAGCSSVRKAVDNANASAAAYSDLQGFIRDQLTTKFGRSVRSVSCSPHVDQVLPGDTADLRCAVVFADGTSYSTPAKITDPSTDPDIATESFSFNDPPAIDITTAPLPSPSVTLAATSPDSLLLAHNLATVLSKLTAGFGRQDLIVQLAIYPGEVEAVIAGNNGEARAVTATYTGALTEGSLAAFEGPRNGIDFSQLVPGVIQRLTELITTKGKVRLGSVSRFVLTNSLPGGNSGWTIYLTSGSTRFQALVLGNDPQIITPGGTHDLN